MPAALLAHQVAGTKGDEMVERLRDGDTFRHDSRASGPDLVSTAIALHIIVRIIVSPRNSKLMPEYRQLRQWFRRFGFDTTKGLHSPAFPRGNKGLHPAPAAHRGGGQPPVLYAVGGP